MVKAIWLLLCLANLAQLIESNIASIFNGGSDSPFYAAVSVRALSNSQRQAFENSKPLTLRGGSSESIYVEQA
jgi:hypothetical protein